MKKLTKTKYNQLIEKISELVNQSRTELAQTINTKIVDTYWTVGKYIVEYEQKGKIRADYGSELMKILSRELSAKHGKGFSIDNLEKMRKFYLTFPNSETLSRKFSWSHYCLIMRLDDPLARKFYVKNRNNLFEIVAIFEHARKFLQFSIDNKNFRHIKEIENENWSVRELDRQINSMVFERIALSKDKKGVLELAQKGQLIEKAEDLVKDPYILEFLGLEKSEKYSETELEEKIITNLQKFLLELGKGFMFVARQQRVTLEDEHFYIDLVFYNRLLKCFVIIVLKNRRFLEPQKCEAFLMELKIGKLTHKDLGQLQMYVNYYDRKIKQKDENPTIGILLCADKKEAIVKYTLPKNNKQLFASKYRLYLPSKEELEKEVEKLV